MDFELSSPIEYHDAGEKAEGRILTFSAPTAKQNKYRVQLQQSFFKAVSSLNSGGEQAQQEGGSAEPTGSEVLMLMLSSDVDMCAVHETFKKMVCSRVCMVEDSTPLTEHLYDQISADDIDSILGEYLANFILRSALQRLAKS